PPRQIPRAMALLCSQADGTADYLAVVLEEETVGRENIRAFSLQIVKLSGAEIVRTVTLWRGRENWPTITATPRGKSVAAAGNDAHEIHVFTIAQLVKGEGEPQVLRSAGATFR